MIIGIDPGPLQSAIVVVGRDGNVLESLKDRNDMILAKLRAYVGERVAIEMVQSFGMPVGAEVFETVFWIGRFAEVVSDTVVRINRGEVKTHHCRSSKANDSHIRQALVDRYGGKDAAIGRKANPGPLYGVKGDCWQALAVALVAQDRYLAIPRAA